VILLGSSTLGSEASEDGLSPASSHIGACRSGIAPWSCLRSRREKTYEQAAVMIECAVGTVRSRLHRARALLARKLVGKECLV
jgi:hypothetical protein